MAPLPHYKSSTTAGLPGGFNPLAALLNPMSMLGLGKKKGGKATAKSTGKGTPAMKAKMAALRALKKKA